MGIGSYSLSSLTNGYENTAIGYNSLYSSVSTTYNVAVGSYAGYGERGDYNTYIGSGSGPMSTVLGNGYQNVGIGFQALNSNLQNSLYDNVAIGVNSGYKLKTGDSNVLIGSYTGDSLDSGSNNILLGYSAGQNLTSGANNIIIGHNADAQSATGSSQLSIGNLIFGSGGFGTGTTVGTGSIGIGAASPTTARLVVKGRL